jgi:hypothetical protein
LLPAIPPLVDVPGHIGRLHLMLGGSPFLDRFYSPGSWPIGNLGVDMFVLALGPAMGAEMATRIIVTLIPPLTVAAMLWVAREAHGRLPPTAAFAVPLAYSHPFLFGFVNYSIGVAFALLTFAVWLRLGNAGRLRARALIMAPLALITFVAHVSAWGLLGLMAFGAEVARRRDGEESWPRAIVRSVVQCLPLALPLILLLLWRSGAGGETSGWFNFILKANRISTIFRDRWMAVDLASLFVVLAMLLYARDRRDLRWSRPLTGAALLVLLAFLIIPGWLFGSAYADMRIAPVMLILIVLAVGVRPGADRRHLHWLAVAAVSFAALRLGAVSVSLHIAADEHRQLLSALDHLPPRSRLVVLVDHRGNRWPLQRNDHIGSMAIARRDSFSNDQWELEGGTTVLIHYPAAGEFQSADSQMVAEGNSNVPSMDQALAALPTDAFDALWLVDSVARPDPKGWVRIYHAPGNDLYLRGPQAGRRTTQP